MLDLGCNPVFTSTQIIFFREQLVSRKSLVNITSVSSPGKGMIDWKISARIHDGSGSEPGESYGYGFRQGGQIKLTDHINVQYDRWAVRLLSMRVAF